MFACILDELLTITLNPAVDYATSIEAVVPGPKLYCKEPRVDPGGGGVNVARAICSLGGRAKALIAVGGAGGQKLCAMLEAEGVPVHAVDVGGETRFSFAVTDESSNCQYRFSLPGDTLTSETGECLVKETVSQIPRGGLAVLSGGVAPGLDDRFPEKIRAALEGITNRLVVDTSKCALHRLISEPVAPLYALRFDHREAERAAGRPLSDLHESIAFLETLIMRGVAEILVMGRGAEGSLVVTPFARHFCSTPKVPVVSKIGAGDAFVGSFTFALQRGDRVEDALRWGVSASAATMATEGTGLCKKKDVLELLPMCQVEVL